ncbi:uncharacterized protein [Nicotiana tomentosiformis]|uniref:uncharacterized protein n=1 Tax=Nicotiana tomentosiformis TaxID=4098 RepID=UPI00388CBAC4
MTAVYSLSLPTFSEEALKETRELKTLDMGGGSSAGDLSELLYRSRFRVDLSECEVELQKVLGGRDALRLLCSQKDEAIKDLQADLAKAREEEAELDKQVSLVLLKYGFDSTVEINPSLSQLQQKVEMIGSLREEVDQIKAECNRWKETIDRLATEKETILTNLLSVDVQFRNVKQKGSAQAKRIEELEAQLAEAKAKVESSKILADKSIDVYRDDAEAAQMEAKELKAEAEALASDGDDDDDDGSKSESEYGREPDREANSLRMIRKLSS